MSLIPKSAKFNLSYDDRPARERLLSAEELENVQGGVICRHWWNNCADSSDCCDDMQCHSFFWSGKTVCAGVDSLGTA